MLLTTKTKLMVVAAMLTFGTAWVVHAETPKSDQAQELQRRNKRRRRKRPPKNGGSGTSKKKFTHVVTVGDSYSSGTGIHRNPRKYDDHGPKDHKWKKRLGASTCYREVHTTPGPKLAKQLGAKSVFGACRGGVIGDINNQFDAIASKVPKKGAKTLINMTIGGNDVLTKNGLAWPALVQKCILGLKPCHKKDKYKIKNFAAVESSLQALYKRVGNRFKDGEIRVLGYPRLMQPRGGKCKGVRLVSAKEAAWIDKQVDELNRRIASAVRKSKRSNVKFVDVVAKFQGHGACEKASNRYLNDKVLGQSYDIIKVGKKYVKKYGNISGTTYSSFHPTQKGYDAFFNALKGSI